MEMNLAAFYLELAMNGVQRSAERDGCSGLGGVAVECNLLGSR